ncbi:MAG: endonuclease/exonuclease/phosphatase family protein [Flavobacteriales bacterium]|nr:endonuclease/exonuclease/phosphatase family protein [Flavobacteriales bacterium]
MKLIQWNCQCSFRTKNDRILIKQPDILVVCECENEERLGFGKLTPQPNDFIWEGKIPHKGIGVFSYSEWQLKKHTSYNPEFEFVIPIVASRGDEKLNFLAIWTQGSNGRIRYIEHVWCALEYYSELIDRNTILIGDFNSNVLWDDNGYIGNHSQTVDRLKQNGIESLYHYSRGIPQGDEPEPTFFLYRKKEKPYHIDYCFAHESLISEDFNIEVGKFEDWSDISDHVPLIVSL